MFYGISLCFQTAEKKVKNYARQQEENRSKKILAPEEKGKLVNTGKKFRYSAEE